MKRSAAFLGTILVGLVGTVTDPGSAAEGTPDEPVPAQKQESPKPKAGEKLELDTEKGLKWGEPSNGLRAALMIRPVPGDPKTEDMPELYLVVQNMAKTAIRLLDATEAPEGREVLLKRDGKIQMSLVSKEMTRDDVLLQPGEVAFLLMFPPDPKNLKADRSGPIIAESVLKDTYQTLVAKLNIEQAPVGAWTGQLRTGDTTGAVAAAATAAAQSRSKVKKD